MAISFNDLIRCAVRRDRGLGRDWVKFTPYVRTDFVLAGVSVLCGARIEFPLLTYEHSAERIAFLCAYTRQVNQAALAAP